MRHLLLFLIPAALLAQSQGNAVVGGTTDESIPRLQVAGSDGTMRVIVCGDYDRVLTPEETQICHDVAAGNPPPGPNTLVIRKVGSQGTSSLMECSDSKCREVKPSKLSRLWRKLKMKGTK